MKVEQPPKRRLVVMNGHRVLQILADDDWDIEKVEKAHGVRPGVYELFKASEADRSKPATGVFVHVDELQAYLQTNAGLFRHDLAAFDHPPPLGGRVTVSYDSQGRASFDA
jgi:hypothetical protein